MKKKLDPSYWKSRVLEQFFETRSVNPWRPLDFSETFWKEFFFNFFPSNMPVCSRKHFWWEKKLGPSYWKSRLLEQFYGTPRSESMETRPLFGKSSFSIFSPPNCKYALENNFDGEKTRSFLLEIPTSGAVSQNSYRSSKNLLQNSGWGWKELVFFFIKSVF